MRMIFFEIIIELFQRISGFIWNIYRNANLTKLNKFDKYPDLVQILLKYEMTNTMYII